MAGALFLATLRIHHEVNGDAERQDNHSGQHRGILTGFFHRIKQQLQVHVRFAYSTTTPLTLLNIYLCLKALKGLFIVSYT